MRKWSAKFGGINLSLMRWSGEVKDENCCLKKIYKEKLLKLITRQLAKGIIVKKWLAKLVRGNRTCIIISHAVGMDL